MRVYIYNLYLSLSIVHQCIQQISQRSKYVQCHSNMNYKRLSQINITIDTAIYKCQR